MVFYLKYRPQKIADLDLPEVRVGLKKLVEAGRVPHALLFNGPRGSGKTSAARIIAKAVNCLKNNGKGEPCNRCLNCQEITRGSFIDLIEIDGASNRGIDDIRGLRENIKLVPAKGRSKIYIIDEVHMLTKEAFNALLKTLEEPPSHALFILCTTAPEKLPETIISRCTRFNFRKAKSTEVKSSLKKVVKGENLIVEKGVLEMIARNVDGSFRDGQKILDQLTNEEKKITLIEASQLLGQIESLSPWKLINVLAGRDVKKGLQEINRLVEAGADLKIYLQRLLEALRLILMKRIGMGDFEEPVELEKLETRAVKRLIRDFSQAVIELKTALIPQLPLELVIIEWGQEKVENSRLPGLAETEPRVGKVQSDNDLSQRKKVLKKEQKANNFSKGNNSGNGKVKLEQIQSRWSEVLSLVKPLNHSVEALLRGCRPHEINGEFLVLEVFYTFHKERLETEKCRSIVEEAAGNVLGFPIKVKCILGERKRNSPSLVEKKEASPDPLAAAEEIFNGKIIN